jgi:hypothetical protein
MTLSVTIETDPLLFGKLMDTGLNDFVLRQNLVMASITDLERVAIACTKRGGSPTVRLVITQIFCAPWEALLRRGATVEIRPAF